MGILKGNDYIDPGDLHPRDRDPPLYALYGLVHPTYAYMPKELETGYGSIAYEVGSRVQVNAADARAQSPRDAA